MKVIFQQIQIWSLILFLCGLTGLLQGAGEPGLPVGSDHANYKRGHSLVDAYQKLWLFLELITHLKAQMCLRATVHQLFLCSFSCVCLNTWQEAVSLSGQSTSASVPDTLLQNLLLGVGRPDPPPPAEW